MRDQLEESERLHHEAELQLAQAKQRSQNELVELQLQAKLLKQQALEERYAREKERMRVEARLKQLDSLGIHGERREYD